MRTPTSVFAQREIDETTFAMLTLVSSLTNPDPIRQRARHLVGVLHQIRSEEERERGQGLAQRIADGLCAVLGETCLTHNETADLGHALKIDPTTSTD